MEMHGNETMINEFVSESRDHLETIEPDLLELERDGDRVSPEVINRVFRAMHSIKGASGFFGFDALTRLTHAMENVFMKFRDKEIFPDPQKTDILLAGVDVVKKMLMDIHASHNIRFDDELAGINAILNGKPPSLPVQPTPLTAKPRHKIIAENIDPKSESVVIQTAAGLFHLRIKGPPGLEDAELELNEAHIAAAHENRSHTLYAAWAVLENGLIEGYWQPRAFFSEIDAIGRCIYSDFSEDMTAKRETLRYGRTVFHVFFGTIIKPDLIEYSLKIPEHRVGIVDLQVLTPFLSEKPECRALTEPPPAAMPGPVSTPSDQNKPKAPETIRVNVELLDRLMNLAGELVLGRNQLRQELETPVRQNPKLCALMQTIDGVTSDIQQDIIRMRMQPIGNLFNKLNRIVRDLSHTLEKQAELFLEGTDVELDKTLLEGLSDPLTHLIRNCMDHGIESPAEREKTHKPPSGSIHVKAFHRDGQISIVVSDDGRGVSPDEIAKKAVKSGALGSEKAGKMTDAEKIDLILLPGFSTAKKITDISGRGVGMDVVKTNIEKLGGTLQIESVPGKGLSIYIRLPLTLAIIPSLVVGTAGQQFAIPQVNIKELVWIKAADVSGRIEKLGDAFVLRLREDLLPLVRLADILDLDRSFVNTNTFDRWPDHRQRLTDRRTISAITDTARGKNSSPARGFMDRRQNWRGDLNVVVLRVGTHLFGLIVDELFNNEEIVVKPLSNHVKKAKCFAGATIMGDGRVAMILDASGIAHYSGLNFSDINLEERQRQANIARLYQTSSARRRSVLIFNNAIDEYFALPLNAIARLESIDSKDIYNLGGKSVMNYRGEGLSLVYMEEILPAGGFPGNLEEVFVIIPKTTHIKAGIIASRIFDTVTVDIDVKEESALIRGISGTAFIENRLVRFINPDDLPMLIDKALTTNNTNAAKTFLPAGYTGASYHDNASICNI
jgi:two-component system, chemotaxis family, sensor kinase CheA